ncbi:MAG TPA: hypothetical protein PLE32_22200 [Haliscomenobacter sp.]|nr:hypothetical protein [Haliscomenobacter sp.]
MSTNIQKQNRKSKSGIASGGGGGASDRMLTISKTSTFSPSLPPTITLQKIDNQIVTLDWLDLKLKDNFSEKIQVQYIGKTGWSTIGEANGIYSLEMQRGGGSSYRQSANVHFCLPDERTFKLGILYWDGMFADIKGTAKLHTEGRWFYEEIPDTSLLEIIQNLLHLLNSDVVGVIRADIAFDSLDNGTLVNKIASGKITPVKPDSLGTLYSKMMLGKRIELGNTMGSRQYGRLIRCYNKTRELNANKDQHKGMRVRERWHAHGVMDNREDVYRIEFELRHNYLKKFKDLVWTDFFDPEKLVKIAERAALNFFDFVPTSVLGDLRGALSPEKQKEAYKLLEKAKKRGKCVKTIDFAKVKTDGYILNKSQTSLPTSRAQQQAAKQLIVSAALHPDSKKAIKYKSAAALLMRDCDLQNYILSKNMFWGDFIAREAKRRNVPINPIIDLSNIAQSLQDGFSSGVKVFTYNPIIAPSESQLHPSYKLRRQFDHLFESC